MLVRNPVAASDWPAGYGEHVQLKRDGRVGGTHAEPSV